MKKLVFLIVFIVLISSNLYSQDGKLLEKVSFTLSDSIVNVLKIQYSDIAANIYNLNYSRITYLSDGLKVTGYVVEPKKIGKYPCIISNRGGNRDLGQWTPLNLAQLAGRMASWDYVVIVSQYRGNDSGQGKEEFGGIDINDVLNLVPVLAQIPSADTSRIGMEGTSRGGMMTYLALKKSCTFKAAAVTGGIANAFNNIASRPDMETYVYSQLIPDYWSNKETSLKERSAVFWATELCKETPLLIMHGSADWRVLPSEALELVNKLYEIKHPTRFILFEGADHGITEFREQRLAETKKHFDYYVRDGNKPPSMEPHGK
jgi:dipeptidyl aminopeptidase/acylaminoacyl peptidase